jgi:hypothetical protein
MGAARVTGGQFAATGRTMAVGISAPEERHGTNGQRELHHGEEEERAGQIRQPTTSWTAGVPVGAQEMLWLEEQ